MTLHKTTEYALTILTFMATRNEDVYSAEYLYEHFHIPRRYLYRLSKHGFSSVIKALEGDKSISKCILAFRSCITGKPCLLHDTWTEARSKMLETLLSTTI